jgi:hypothetical protein
LQPGAKQTAVRIAYQRLVKQCLMAARAKARDAKLAA